MSSSEVALVTPFCNSHEFKTEGNSSILQFLTLKTPVLNEQE